MFAALVLATAAAVTLPAVEHHVRSDDAWIRSVLAQGLERSETLRRLVLILDRSDVIVYLVPSRRERLLGGYLMHTVTAAGGIRYLRARIVDRGTLAVVVATIAHELQHAIEVAQSPDVKDSRSMGALFSRLAKTESCGVGDCYETAAARLVGKVVREEVRASVRERGVASTALLTTD